MASEFYRDYFDRKIPLTGLFIEHLGNKMKKAPEDIDPVMLLEILEECLIETGLLKEPTEEQLVSVLKDLQSCYEEGKKDTEGTTWSNNKGKNFAGYLQEWATSLSYDKLCLYVAGFDYVKAREYFETRDQRSIVAIADEKLRLEFELARVSFEASLFGFGGGYKATPKEGDADFDLTSDDEVAVEALKSFGF